MTWGQTYSGPGGARVEVRWERDVMGESEVHVRVRNARGEVIYEDTDPGEAMAFSADGARFYVQDQYHQGRMQTLTISTRTGRRSKRAKPPVVGDAIVDVSDLIQAAGHDLLNGARFELVSEVAAGAPAMASKKRLATLERLLGAPPRAALWQDVMELFRCWAAGDVEQGVDRALSLLDERWEEYRVWAPWMRVLEPHPAWRLLTVGPREVSLYQKKVGDAGARALAREPLMASLTSLKLVGNDLTEAGVSALVGPRSHLQNLRDLSLSSNPIGDGGALALACSPHLASLTELAAGECQIGPDGAWALASSSHLGKLRNLVLSFNPIGEQGARALAESAILNPPDCDDSRRCHVVQSAVNDKIFRFLQGREEPEPEPSLLVIDGRKDSRSIAFRVAEAVTHPFERPVPLEVTHADLTGGDFLGRAYRGATFTECDFSGVRLLTATFQRSTLSSCTFTGANLESATFGGVTLECCMFNEARLVGATFRSCTVTAGHFGDGANLDKTDWLDTVVTRAYFRGASFKRAIFKGGVFTECDLRDTNLQEAMFEGTRFIRCDLRGADFGEGDRPEGVFTDCRF